MQDIENDMDDLFKRAADNYPLQPGNGDWDNIAKRIADESPAEIVAPVSRKINKKILTLLALLISSLFAWLIFDSTKTSVDKYAIKDQTENKKPAKNSNPVVYVDTQLHHDSIVKNTNDVDAKKTARPGTQKPGLLMAVINPNSGSSMEYRNKDESIISNVKKNVLHNNDNSLPGNYIKNPAAEGSLNNLDKKREIVVNNITSSKPVDSIHNGLLIKDSVDRANSTGVQKKTNKQNTQLQKKGIYIGLFFGPDFSKVRSTSFNSAGLDAGLIVGVRVNSKLSFETGVWKSKKNYTSEGKMFKMDQVGSTMPSGMIINNLESQSSLIEIPIGVKYELVNTGQSAFFISAAVSAYIMTKEKNHYNTTVNGVPEKLTGVYEKNDYGLPAVVNFGIGYEHCFSRNIQLRIEPFLKVPLQGMGIGSLPVTSAGLHVGLTHLLR